MFCTFIYVLFHVIYIMTFWISLAHLVFVGRVVDPMPPPAD
jgi:hypothetical protein